MTKATMTKGGFHSAGGALVQALGGTAFRVFPNGYRYTGRPFTALVQLIANGYVVFSEDVKFRTRHEREAWVATARENASPLMSHVDGRVRP